ncbi:hypothetical protein SLS60_008693 [Paraconiothyrium brasiliense]|uniref:Asl1-like glycosyl hydrolase catalytic domain-containing protein n=1 Tax=Paraconiothyrium brasiliense TaxID=300254 RepID=A0ABR3QY80_9PLEO
MAFFRCVAVAALLTLATASTSSKRGLCFVPEKHRRDHPHPEDNAIWATRRSDLTWYYNYEAAPSADYKGMTGFEFVPMLWGVPDGGLIGTPFLDSIRQQIKNGLNITHVLGFNEPDASDNGGSNISPHLAAQIWKANVEPLKEDGIKLGAPAITGSPRGAMWLQDFLSHCNGSCNPDFLPLHFYGDFESMASKIGEVTRAYPQLPIWVTEWGYSNQSLHDTHWAFNESLRLFDNWW